MGFALPAALGAKMGGQSRDVIAVIRHWKFVF
jgi:thiamine pyrophosphate-dependent acetolactate synthase large subunit-like protein